MECAIYHKKHKFTDYPILNDIAYLTKHFISYCILINCTQKQMSAATNHLDANWATDDNTTDELNGISDYSHANIKTGRVPLYKHPEKFHKAI